ncbi:hypothetical protein CFP56_026346 [Quercus suber]|uniref:Uncharacterized protein n=1 Tax=Quercus suber TaxID=58331 RepID=A0AAW0K221_QUESU
MFGRSAVSVSLSSSESFCIAMEVVGDDPYISAMCFTQQLGFCIAMEVVGDDPYISASLAEKIHNHSRFVYNLIGTLFHFE